VTRSAISTRKNLRAREKRSNYHIMRTQTKTKKIEGAACGEPSKLYVVRTTRSGEYSIQYSRYALEVFI
jgi:hypothetical protein